MNRKDEIKARLQLNRPTRVFSYIHGQGRIGVLLEIESDTDFALKNELVETFAHEVCLQIASMDPVSVDTDCESRVLMRNVFDEDVIVREPEIRAKIINGKLAKWDKQNILLIQPWVKDNQQTVGDLLTNLCGKLSEGVKVLRFQRFGE